MRLGIIGGGQLGRMLALAAHQLGVSVSVLDPAPDAPAAAVATHLCAAYGDAAALDQLAATCDAVTYEFESLPAEALDQIATQLPLRPGVASLRAAQDRLHERELFASAAIPTAPSVPIHDVASLAAARDHDALYPGRLKTRRGGYDGHGQRPVDEPRALQEAWRELGAVPCMLEAHVAFRRELSVIVVRGADGEVRCWPVVENRHEQGVLAVTLAPAPGLDHELERAAQEIATRLVSELDHVGVLAVELFETEEGLLANELAPRVHNSGHWTIEGSRTSQFANHVRAVLGLPLGDTELACPAVMCNLLGSTPPIADVLALPLAALHVYGKAPRPGRKLAHVTQLVPHGDVDAAAIRLVEQLGGGSVERGASSDHLMGSVSVHGPGRPPAPGRASCPG